jgi:hypothetical protein
MTTKLRAFKSETVTLDQIVSKDFPGSILNGSKKKGQATQGRRTAAQRTSDHPEQTCATMPLNPSRISPLHSIRTPTLRWAAFAQAKMN